MPSKRRCYEVPNPHVAVPGTCELGPFSEAKEGIPRPRCSLPGLMFKKGFAFPNISRKCLLLVEHSGVRAVSRKPLRGLQTVELTKVKSQLLYCLEERRLALRRG